MEFNGKKNKELKQAIRQIITLATEIESSHIAPPTHATKAREIREKAMDVLVEL